MTNATLKPPGARAPATGERLRDAHFALVLMTPALVLFLAVICYPLIYSMYVGFTDTSLLTGAGTFVGLDNVVAVFRSDFWAYLRHTAVFTVGATAASFALGLALALALNTGLRGQAILRGLFLLPWLLPGVVVSFLWLWLLDANFGVVNGVLTSAGLIESNVSWLGSANGAMASVILAKAWHSFPWMAVLFLAALQNVPTELYEAVMVDGGGAWRKFRTVTVPHLRSAMLLAALLETIWNFQHFETIYVMTHGGPAGSTTTFSVGLYSAAFEAYDLGTAGAIGVLWMLILSALVVVYIRRGQESKL